MGRGFGWEQGGLGAGRGLGWGRGPGGPESGAGPGAGRGPKPGRGWGRAQLGRGRARLGVRAELGLEGGKVPISGKG